MASHTADQPVTQAQVLDIIRAVLQTQAENPQRPRLSEPPKFDGKAEELNVWLYKVEQELQVRRIADETTRVQVGQSYLAGAAAHWHVNLVLRNQLPGTWADYVTALRARFAPKLDQATIRDKLLEIRQRGTLTTYIAEFEKLYLMVEGMDEATLVRVFMRGLSSQLAPFVAPHNPQTVRAAIDMARMIQESRGGSRPNSSTPDPAAPMEVDAIAARRARLTDQERTRLRQEGACFKCRQRGHVAKECPENRRPATSARPNGQSQ